MHAILKCKSGDAAVGRRAEFTGKSNRASLIGLRACITRPALADAIDATGAGPRERGEERAIRAAPSAVVSRAVISWCATKLA